MIKVIWTLLFWGSVISLGFTLYGYTQSDFPYKHLLNSSFWVNLFWCVLFGFLAFREPTKRFENHHSGSCEDAAGSSFSSSDFSDYNGDLNDFARQWESDRELRQKLYEQDLDNRREEQERKAEQEEQEWREARWEREEEQRRMDEEFEENRQRKLWEEEEERRRWYENDEY